MRKRVALYVRVSTTDQDYQRQIDELTEYSIRNSYDIRYTFEEKISGASDIRTEFDKMIMLDRENIDAVLCIELSRLSRKMSGLIKTIDDFARKGVSVISLKERFESLDDNGNMTPQTIMMLSVSSAMVQIERDTIKERTISGKRHKILSGDNTYTGNAPFGYRIENKKLVIDGEEALKVRDIYDMYKNGMVLDNISGVMKMSRKSIYNILTNEVYTGRRYSKVIDGYVNTPEIISHEIFDEIQNKLKSNRLITRSSINTSPLKGKMVCSCCGYIYSKHGGEKSPRWSCHKCNTTITDGYALKCTEMALESIKSDLGYGTTKKKIKEHIEALWKKSADMSELVDNMYDKIDEEKKKLEVLKNVFSPEQLKREVNEIKAMERERDKQNAILQNIFKEINKEQESIDNDNIDESVIEKIVVEKVDKYNKILTYHIYNRVIKVHICYRNLKKPTFVIFK